MKLYRFINITQTLLLLRDKLHFINKADIEFPNVIFRNKLIVSYLRPDYLRMQAIPPDLYRHNVNEASTFLFEEL